MLDDEGVPPDRSFWWQQPMIGFDLETTSADPEHARIVTSALVWVDVAAPVKSVTALVNPGVEIPQESIDVHGITNEMVQADGIEPRRALDQIMVAFRDAVAFDRPVVIFNARYDLTVADRNWRREFPEHPDLMARVIDGLKIIDPMQIERHLDRFRPKRVASHSLEDCCRVWNVKLDAAHDAAFDALAALRLAYRLCSSGVVKRRPRNRAESEELLGLTQQWNDVRVDVDRLFVWTRQIAEAEADRLQAYFRAGDPKNDRAPEPDAVCPRDWPMIPYRSDSSVIIGA